MNNNLDAILNPASVAVIGASNKEGGPGYSIMRNIIREGFTGKLYPVNLKDEQIMGVKAYKSILDVEGTIDLAVIIVPAKAVADTIEQCGQKGVKGAVIITAGFKEVKGEGVVLEQQVVDAAKKHGITIIGPNCLGVLNTNPGTSLNAAFAPVSPVPGVIGFASQSGALCSGILNVISTLNIGVKHLVSLGNQASISANDFMEYWADSDEVEQVLLYLESMQNPSEFLNKAKQLSAKKPLIVIKSGRSDEGGKAAQSHTGSLSNEDGDCQAVFDSCGAIREVSLQAMFNTASVFENCPVPKGKRVGIVTNTGGLGVLATDKLIEEGMELSVLSNATVDALKVAINDDKASVKNPVDTIASVTMTRYAKAVDLVLQDDNVDMVLALFIYLYEQNKERDTLNDLDILRELNNLKAKHPDKPIIGVLMTTEDFKERANKEIKDNSVPYFSYIDEAVWGLKRLCDRSEYLESLKTPRLSATAKSDLAGKVIGNAKKRFADDAACKNTLTTFESLEVFKCYGLPVPEYALIKDENDIDKHIGKIGFPAVLKVSSFHESHKTEIGGVVLNIQSKEQLVAEYRSLLVRIGGAKDLDGIVLMQQIKGAREFFAGIKSFEDVPLLSFGLGGIFVEALKEVKFVALPLDENGCRQLLSSKRIKNLLGNLRKNHATGEYAIKAVSIEKLRGLFYGIDRFLADFPEISELDLNPIMADNHGNIHAVDARITLK